jgi:2-isopropylmalate synthase
MNQEKLYIFDTTLRDGEQSAGVALTKEEKLRIAEQLKKLKVDIIEAGFPIASKEELETVKLIAKNIDKDIIICALSRTKKEDIDAAYEAIKYAKRRRIHTFISSSDIHIKYQLRKTREEIIDIVKTIVSYAKNYTDDIEFSPMDATRTEFEFLYKIIETAISAGATVINIPDTVGYATPEEFALLIKNIKENVRDIDRVIISVHCHDDLGLAVANTLAAVQSGARQVEVTVNGIGERAGNAALEEVVMAINTRKNRFSNLICSVDTTQIINTSKLVSSLTGMVVQPNKAIVGKNAFLHESGIHQHGILKSPLTYEIITPESIGLISPKKITIGKLSGRHALAVKLKELGYADLSQERINEIFLEFKELAAKKRVYDEDLIALVEEKLIIKEHISLEDLQVYTGKGITPTATVKLRIDNSRIKQEAACGDGPVDAVHNAITKILNKKIKLIDYSLQALTEGSEASGKVIVKIKYKNKLSSGIGVDTDIIVASAKAIIQAINKLI